VYIEPDKTKNQDGKVYYFDDDMKQRFINHYNEMEKLDKVDSNDYVFQNNRGQIKDFRKDWKKALIEAGLPETMLFHDLRRSGIINMVNSGVPYNVVMKVSGHKTRAVFDRYFITPEEELRSVSQRVSEYLDKKKN
jgi:integrase